ncbi:MAG: hypothetical protein A3F84_20320 [Candidatus Handelsmanbacteria bacterium RIFCSPLOWO2_12_FULL_64_10]|uniref:Uncharacterized protein n=1 Tax=Handelsmanbacteria sp. (strain RIFCSPLOWO2_12_FULL_64_10) TaxID=1817868 RepID=A0A1F6CCJ1_HANXR|nr:MAG: hypothetical protein A3F84_20320 [Candidatus Handelsmanbacteria bacterium RIFCSPLOWO2_12_FULL_64_10]
MAKKNEKKDDTFRIDEIREMFDNEWVLVEVTRLRGPGQPSRGRVLAHHKSRMKIARMTRKFHAANPGKMSYTLFSGEVIPKGVVVVLMMIEFDRATLILRHKRGG